MQLLKYVPSINNKYDTNTKEPQRRTTDIYFLTNDLLLDNQAMTMIGSIRMTQTL